MSQESIEATFDRPIALPDHVGTWVLKKTHERRAALWQDESGQTHQEVLSLPLAGAKIWIRFRYSGKVKLTPNGVNKDIKKVWQQLNVAPWQRQRIPLIFYDDKLQSAVGFFTVFQD